MRKRAWPMWSRHLAIGVCLAALILPGSVRAASTPAGVALAPDFNLVDQNGHAFKLSGHRGQPLVLFFGYTHCPDVCPTILANLRRAREVIGPKGRDILIVFITVDRERDTRAALRQYVEVFGAGIVGLTGSAAQLDTVYRAYHVKYAKLSGDASGYLVSHSAFVYYIGRGGRLRGYGTWDDSQEILKEELEDIVSSQPAT